MVVEFRRTRYRGNIPAAVTCILRTVPFWQIDGASRLERLRRRYMEIVYLDQNKWIDLARVYAGTGRSGSIADVYVQLVAAVESNQVIFPLSVSHVLETSKRNDPVSRIHLAATQSKLSRGYAYRSRAGRLEIEIRATLLRLFGVEAPELPKNWAIAHGFLQAFEPMDALIAPAADVQRMARVNAVIDPAEQYLDFMTNQDDARRRAAHVHLTAGTNALVSRIEERRARLSGESVDLRRRAYAVHLFMDHQETFIRILNSLGYTFEQLKALGGRAVQALVQDVPTLNVEAEMAARLESKTGSISPNDVFDMQSFYTAIPYSSRVIAEKGSISRARQAKLDTKYEVVLSKSLNDLIGVYPPP